MALITCPECGKEISDKALSCPNCGLPMNLPPTQIETPQTPVRRLKYRKLPNGFGCIRKLSGNRRNPYACYPHIEGYRDNGSALPRKAIGYYKTYNEAFDALSAYNKNPYDLKSNDTTFAEVYKMYFDDKYTNSKKNYSKTTLSSTEVAFKNLSAIHNRPIRSLKTYDIQRVIDACELKHASIELMVSLVKQMYDFAMQNDIVEKNYGKYVKVKVADDDEKGIPFSESDINILWEHVDDKIVQFALIMIYSGMRIKEYKVCQIDLENRLFIGGLKTQSGKNRVVPIHSKIYDFVKDFDQESFNPIYYRADFKSKLKELGILNVKDTVHTPHDTRHTFSYLCDKYKMDTISKHLIMGHSLGKDVESNTYGHRTIEDLRHEIEKIK